MDVGYRRALTKLLKTRLSDVCQGDLVLQLGSMFNSTEIVRGKCECWSYNDGNFAIASKSPHFPKEISQKKVDVTIQYEQEVVDSLSKILTMSEYLRKSFIEDYNCSPDKVSCIGCGINLDNLPEDKAKKISDRPNLLFIGVDFQRKGGQDTIDAFREVKSSFPEALLHIVGPREYRKEFDAVPDIRWHGFLDKNKPSELTQLDNLFREATLFIMPSRYEPFGIAPLEAMSYRLPCIVSNAWALPEIVSEGETGELVEPNNPVVLAEKIISLLGSHDRLLQYGQAGRKRVEEYFSWTKVVDRLEKILK
jgi:glycosyltransferase involved in cell wall biosynthesis